MCAPGSTSTAPIQRGRQSRERRPSETAPTASSSTPRPSTRAATEPRIPTSTSSATRSARHFPTALSSFPYVDYHPSFPYSVFLGKGGARFNLPQVYWHAIGVGVGQADRHTIRYNRVYERGIYPVGQTYKDAGGRPSKKQIQKFRRLAISFGFPGVSWWSLAAHEQEAVARAGPRTSTRIKGVRRGSDNYPGLSKGDKGDLVVWAQEHLRGAGAHLAVDRRLRQEDAPRREALPAQAPPARRRQDRPANLA